MSWRKIRRPDRQRYLEQLDSNITGDKITYLVKEQKMQAFSDKGKRVTTVLVPSQLQDKSGNQQRRVTNSLWQH
jgi:lipopolysaccharide export system protein LptA